MRECWNCGCKPAIILERCPDCGQALAPDAAQRDRAQDNIAYVISEIRRWKSVPDWWKAEAEDSYRKRVRVLRAWKDEIPAEVDIEVAAAEVLSAGEISPVIIDSSLPIETVNELTATSDVPEVPLLRGIRRRTAQPLDATPFQEMLGESETAAPQDTSLPTMTPVQRVQGARLPLEAPSFPQEPAAPSEADIAMRMLMDAFSEKKIRLLYALGGVLLLSAGVGTLRSSWDGWGRQVMALLLILLPVLFYWLAQRLRETLPVSSRMFTVLSGAMLPIGVLFLNTFGGLHAPPTLWNPLAFAIGFVVNVFYSRRANEPLCVYLAGLCWGLAGWTSGSGLLLGLVSFAGALGLFFRSPDIHWARVGHGLSVLGLLSAFTHNSLDVGGASTLFLFAIFYFTAMAWSARTSLALVLSALICVACSWWMTSLLQWPMSSLGVLTLIQGTMYLGRRRQLEGELGDTAENLAIYLTGTVLIVTLGLPLFAEFLNRVGDFPSYRLFTMIFTGMLAAIYYAAAALRFQRPAWLYGSAISLFYAYFSFIALNHHTDGAAYRPWLMGAALLVQVLTLLLRGRLSSNDYLRPWAHTAVAIALLTLPINFVLQLIHVDGLTPWIYLAGALSTTLAALFDREPKGLYASCLVAAAAYATWLPIWFGPSAEPNLGYAFAPFITLLALLGIALKRREGADYGTPLLVTAGVAGWGFSLLQIAYLMGGYWKTTPPALAFYGIAAAVCAWKLPNWARYLHFHSALCLVTSVAALDHFGVKGVGVGLVLCAGLIGWARTGWLEAALFWTAGAAWLGPGAVKIFPALIWLVAAAGNGRLSKEQRPKLAQAATLLLLPAWPSCWKAWPNLLLLVASLLQAGMAWRWRNNNLVVLAWLNLKAVYFCAFGLSNSFAWSVALWLEWLAAYFYNRRADKPEVAVEGLTMFTLLGVSVGMGGLPSVINPWLVGGLLIWRSLQASHASLYTLAQMVIVWACAVTAREAKDMALIAPLLFGWSYVCLALTMRSPEQRNWNLRSMSAFTALGWFACFAGEGAGYWAGVLSFGSLAWLLRARITQPLESQPSGAAALWVTFGLLYNAYAAVLWEAGATTIELYTVPIGAWLLFWGSLISDSPGSRQVGVLGLVLPSLFLSLFSAEHALWAGSMGLILLVWGQFRNRSNMVAWGGLTVLAEVAIQMVSVVSHLPWHIWAVVGGLILVGVAALVERRRREVLAASRNFVMQLNSW